MAVLPQIAKAVLEADDSPIRFERFCLGILSEAEGIQFLPTSRTRDLGRDGRPMSLVRGVHMPILCATLDHNIDAKVRLDIRRLAETTQTTAIVYCSSRHFTEEKRNEIEGQIRGIYEQVESIRVLGQVQLIALAEQHEGIVRQHYGGEILNMEEALLLRSSELPEAKEVGLRLALITHGGDDALLLRRQLALHLVEEALLITGPGRPTELAQAITARLHLPRSISTAYMEEVLSELERSGLVDISDGVAQLTAAGATAARDVPDEALEKLLEGRLALRDAIRSLSGYEIDADQFNSLWKIFQDGITELFYNHGLDTVRMVRWVLAEEQPSATKKRFFPIEELAERAASIFTVPDKRETVCQAIIDVFCEKNNAAFQWLTQVCGVYVMMCSLGFETLSNQQITSVIAGFRLVCDSDVAISFLCEGEDNHLDVERILGGWKAIGGKLMTVKPVLEEIAYHAWIAENDFNAFGAGLGRLSDDQARHLVSNAFVRAYWKLAGESATRRGWNRYISQFRGDSEYDFTLIYEHLRENAVAHLSEATEEQAGFARRVEAYVAARMSEVAKCSLEELNPKAADKAARDGRLIASVLASREASRQAGEPANTCIVTSSRLLKEVDEMFRDELGMPDAVMSTTAMGFLLMLCPQVNMGFGTLRSVLFDRSLAVRMTPAQRYAYRVIAQSEEYDLPHSKRATLHRELGRVLFAQARAQGVPSSGIGRQVFRTDDPDYSAAIVAKALDNMAVDSKSKEEVSRLKAEARRLQEEVETLRDLQKTKSAVGRRGLPKKKSGRK